MVEENKNFDGFKETLRAKAYTEACGYFFCNVGDDDYPKDPVEFLEGFDATEQSFGEYERDGKRLEVYEPFEMKSAIDLIEMVENQQDVLYADYCEIADSMMKYMKDKENTAIRADRRFQKKYQEETKPEKSKKAKKERVSGGR